MSKRGFWLPGLLLLAGCGVGGNWELRDVNPPEAIGHFDLTAVTFKPDNTYVARLRKAERTEISRGTYDYDDWKRKLTLHSYGVERAYRVTIWFWTQLRVESLAPGGKPMTAIMARTNTAVTPPSRGRPSQNP